MANLIGQRLGNYRLLRLIGRGGFADVYLAEHIHLGTQAAIKVLQVRLVESNRENFLNEARTIAHLVHPYIIRVLDFGVENEIPFLVMDYAPRGTFRQRYLQGKPLPAAPLVSFMKQTAAALQYGHDKKLIHRDVKPENMLLGPNDEVLLSDFGFALIAHNSTTSMPTETAGTAAYMAPEQLQGKPRPASDQYALGVIAYEWLSGSCPFQGSFFEIASQQVFTPPPPLREKVPTIANEIVEVVMTALAKDPQLRFPSVRDFALALEEACLISKQYAFNLPVAQQPAPKQSKTSGVTFPTGDQRSRNQLPLHNDTRYPLIDSTKDAYKRFSIDAANSSTPSGVSQNMHEEPVVTRKKSYMSIGRIRPFTGTASEHEHLFPPHRSASRIQLLSPDTASDSRLSSAPAGAPISQLSPDSASRPQSPYAFSMDMQPQLQAKNLRESPTKELSTSSPTLPQGYHQPEVLPPGASSTRIQLYTSMPDQPKAALAYDQGLQSARSRRNIQDLAAPLYSQPTRNGLGGPNKILLTSLLILLVLGVGAGLYSYAHNGNKSTAQTASPAQKKAKAQPTTLVAISPTMTPSPTVDTANPYPPYSGTFVMNEPLTSNNYGWQESTATTIGGRCGFVEGGYQDYNPIIDPNPCFANNTNFANFTYQLDMKFISIGQLHSGGGIIFRGNSTTNKYYYFEVYNSGKYSMQVCNAGDCTRQLAGYKSDNQVLKAFHPGLNVINTLAVVAAGPKFDLYVNNQLIKEVVDPNNTYTIGMIGVLATGGNDNDLRKAATSTPGQVLFSNAKVWKI